MLSEEGVNSVLIVQSILALLKMLNPVSAGVLELRG
jgi:hypothetical protein